MNKPSNRLFTAIVLGLFVWSAHSTPSTQIWIPSTDIQAYLNPHFGWDIYQNVHGNGLLSNGGITMGVLPSKKVGMEVGIDYRDINGVHAYPVYFNFKIGVPEGAFCSYMPALAAGGYDFGLKPDVTSYNLIYGLAAKNILGLGRFSLGAYKGAMGADAEKLFYVASKGFDPVSGKPVEVSDAGLLASWDRTLKEISDKLWAAIDFQSGGNGYGALSFGLSWAFSGNTSVIAGYDIYLDSDALKPTATLQFDLNLF